MKLGTQTGSLVNHLHSRATIGQPTPVVGMGATLLHWSDRRATTITQVTELVSKVWQWEIQVVRDNAVVISGSAHDGSAKYNYTPGAGGASLFRFNKKTKSWVEGCISRETGRFCKLQGGLRIGERDEYHDPSF